jgi:outer membrane protein assembly factor BamB
MKQFLCGLVAVGLLAGGAEETLADYVYWADAVSSYGNNGDIQRANLDGTVRSSLVTGLSTPIGIALDVAGGTMYWAAPNFPNPEIGRANLDGTGRTTLISLPNAFPLLVALDLANGKIYWTEPAQSGGPGQSIPAHIVRANLDGTSITRILSLSDVGGIALEPKAGKLYWSDRFNREIGSANLDGTGRTTLITGLNEPRFLALDAASGKLYWTDGGNKDIESANLDGTGRATIVAGLGGPTGVALDAASGKIYWADAVLGDIESANLDATARTTLVSGLQYPWGIALQMGPVPEPSTFLLLGIGALAVIGWTRRRRIRTLV